MIMAADMSMSGTTKDIMMTSTETTVAMVEVMGITVLPAKQKKVTAKLVVHPDGLDGESVGIFLHALHR